MAMADPAGSGLFEHVPVLAEAVLAGLVTVRLGWPQVIDACATARLVAGVLAARGWRGRPRRCSGACSAEDPRQ